MRTQARWIGRLACASCLAALAVTGAALYADQHGDPLATQGEMSRLDRDISARTLVVTHPSHLGDLTSERALSRVHIIRLSARDRMRPDTDLGDRADFVAPQPAPFDETLWSPAVAARLLDWVSRGNVLWVDVAYAPLFGMTQSVAGGGRRAVVAAGAQEHALAQGVTAVECMDAFRYVTGLPPEATPVLVSEFRPEHVILAAWPVGLGTVIIRPEDRPRALSWHTRGRRSWVEPGLLDGGRLLHNLNAYTAEVLTQARRWPGPDRSPVVSEETVAPAVAREVEKPRLRGLLEAFRGGRTCSSR